MCVKKEKDTATISTFFAGLAVWPIVMMVQSYRKNVDNLYLIISIKQFYEIT